MVAVITPTNLHTDFDVGGAVPNKISVVQATDTVRGKVALATAANFPQPANDVDAATPAYVAAAIAGIGALPVVVTDTFGVNIYRAGNP